MSVIENKRLQLYTNICTCTLKMLKFNMQFARSKQFQFQRTHRHTQYDSSLYGDAAPLILCQDANFKALRVL